MRKFINTIAVLIIMFSLGCMIGLFPLEINELEVPLLVIVGAIASINISASMKTYLVRPGRYTSDPSTFVDRNSQINSILNTARIGRNIINVFGMTGIGVTRLQQFAADIINKRLPYKLRRKHCNKPLGVLGAQYRSYYINAGSITSIRDILAIISDSIFTEGAHINATTMLCKVLKQKLKSKKLILFFDGICNREQMLLMEEFATQYFPLRPKDTLVLGTHHKSLSYQYNYEYVEILEFNKEDLMIMAKAYNVDLNEQASIQLYEITEGIPMFAYLLLKDNTLLEISGLEDISDVYAYLRQFVVPSISATEHKTLETVALLSLSIPAMGKKELQLVGLDIDDNHTLSDLYNKGLVQFSVVRKEVSVPRVIVKAFLAYSMTHDDTCKKLYTHFKKINKDHFAILYLLLSHESTHADEHYIEKHLKAWLRNNDILSLLLALTPSVELSVNMKEKHSKLYALYIYACAYAFSSSGNYPKSKELLNRLIVDGTIIKRYDCELNEWDFSLHFLWADIEHLMNNYVSAIDIIESLVANSHTFDNLERLPKLYWMKAHCLRHQAKNLSESFRIYKECRTLADAHNQNEYVIRSIHGQICISFITNNTEFDFDGAFTFLDDIYLAEGERWNVYKYNTRKYESLYYRLCRKEKDASFILLQEAMKGFVKIKKRNIYDIYFEFGEYHRYWGEYDESRAAYKKCIEFAKKNLDYNLESLAQLGIILTDMSTGAHIEPTEIIAIQKNALIKDIHLTVQYTQQILHHLRNGEDKIVLSMFNP